MWIGYFNYLSRKSSVGIAMGYWMDVRNSVSGRDKRYFSSSIQTDIKSQPDSYPMGT
jgi:hypothetical protein